MTLIEIAPFVFLIFIVAVLYGSVGHGGASGYIAVLSLTTMTGVQVSSTALSLNLFVSAIAWMTYAMRRLFNWQLTWPFLVSSVPAAYYGSRFSIDEVFYFILLAIVLVYSAGHILIKADGAKSPVLKRNFITVLIAGAIIGFLSGLIGVGGGIFLSPLIVLLGWADAKTTAATTAIFIFVNSLAGIFGRLSVGLFVPQQLFPLIIVASFGGLVGSTIGAKWFSNLAVRRTLSIVLLVAALKLLYDVLRT